MAWRSARALGESRAFIEAHVLAETDVTEARSTHEYLAIDPIDGSQTVGFHDENGRRYSSDDHPKYKTGSSCST